MADIGNFMLVLNNYNVKNTTLQLFEVDREDHFWRPGFLHIIMCFPGVQSLKFRYKNWMLPMFKKPENLNGLTVNLVQGLLNNVPALKFFFAFL